MPTKQPLKLWMKQQAAFSARAILSGISATHLTKVRDVFAQSVTPAAGSMLASPGMGNWDPEPDYFFHWWRDAAVVMGAINTLSRNASSEGAVKKWNRLFDTAVDFNLKAMRSDNRYRTRQSEISSNSNPEFRKYLRLDADMEKLLGDQILADTRINPDGTVDILTWARPQYDGPALMALAVMEHMQIRKAQGYLASPSHIILINKTLDFTLRHADEAGIDLWEEDGNVDQHYYTSVIQLGAMYHGAIWARQEGYGEKAEAYDLCAMNLTSKLDQHWSPEFGVYKTARHDTRDGEGVIDASTILAVNLAKLPNGRHSVRDDRVQATVAKLEELFEQKYPINTSLAEGVAIGRSRDDKFFGNNPWYWTTAGLGEFYYRLAASVQEKGPVIENPTNRHFCERVFAKPVKSQQQVLKAHGDAQMAVIRCHTPPDKSFSEQFNAVTGKPVSAPHLGMSYAGFINAVACRP